MKAAALALALPLLAGCTPPPGAAPPGAPPQAAADGRRQCFYASTVSGYREAESDEALYLRAGVRDIYRLDFLGSCPGVEWSMGRIGLQQRGGGGTICDGMDVDVLIENTGFPRRCPVRDVRRLTDAEVAALPDKHRP